MSIGGQDIEAKKDALQRARAKRGYVLPYHKLFLSLDLDLFAKYDAFYTALTLEERYLPARYKELVWVAILAVAEEEAGSIHLTRAEVAGITTTEIAAALTIASLVKGFSVWPFVAQHWQQCLQELDTMQAYDSMITKLALPLEPDLQELIFIGAATALPHKQLLRHHLMRANRLGVADEMIAEAMSYIFIPCGGNQLLDMAAVLGEMLQEGQVKANSIFSLWQEMEK